MLHHSRNLNRTLAAALAACAIVPAAAAARPAGNEPAGGSQAPDELVRSVGMDITDPGFWDAGLQILDGMVGQVEQLSKT